MPPRIIKDEQGYFMLVWNPRTSHRVPLVYPDLITRVYFETEKDAAEEWKMMRKTVEKTGCYHFTRGKCVYRIPDTSVGFHEIPAFKD